MFENLKFDNNNNYLQREKEGLSQARNDMQDAKCE